MRGPCSSLLFSFCVALGLGFGPGLASPSRAAVVPEAVPASALVEVGPTLGRPRIGLVLSGGGARGLAHVGVLKVLEREHIPIDAIAGTSMGAIIGGLYASGLRADDLERELLALDWTTLFANRLPRETLSERRKEEDFEISPALEVGLSRSTGELMLPIGSVSSRGLELLLRRYTLPVRQLPSFDVLPIPFRAVATDMESGEAVIFREGDLAQALRASMSVPGVFPPTEVDHRILGDGGLVNNLPVDVVRAMGVDLVIAVNIGTPLAGRDSLGTVLGLTSQMVNILTEQNVQRSIATLDPAHDLLIAPPLGRLTSGDFDRAIDLIAAGEQHTVRMLPQLAALRLNEVDWQALRRAQTRPENPPKPITSVRFEGQDITAPERLRGVLAVQPGQLLVQLSQPHATLRQPVRADIRPGGHVWRGDGERLPARLPAGGQRIGLLAAGVLLGQLGDQLLQRLLLALPVLPVGVARRQPVGIRNGMFQGKTSGLDCGAPIGQ